MKIVLSKYFYSFIWGISILLLITLLLSGCMQREATQSSFEDKGTDATSAQLSANAVDVKGTKQEISNNQETASSVPFGYIPDILYYEGVDASSHSRSANYEFSIEDTNKINSVIEKLDFEHWEQKEENQSNAMVSVSLFYYQESYIELLCDDWAVLQDITMPSNQTNDIDCKPEYYKLPQGTYERVVAVLKDCSDSYIQSLDIFPRDFLTAFFYSDHPVAGYDSFYTPIKDHSIADEFITAFGSIETWEEISSDSIPDGSHYKDGCSFHNSANDSISLGYLDGRVLINFSGANGESYYYLSDEEINEPLKDLIKKYEHKG